MSVSVSVSVSVPWNSSFTPTAEDAAQSTILNIVSMPTRSWQLQVVDAIVRVECVIHGLPAL